MLYVHPFAEEMNKSRRMAALQARALAAAGFDVLQMDLLGCGDSSGDFGDASWAAWVDDVVVAGQWLHRQCGSPPALWALRAGCLLATAAAAQIGTGRFIFWQPPVAGKPLVQQFLRLRMAAQLGGADGGKGVVEGLRQELAAGQSVNVGGYVLAPALAAGLDSATLSPPAMTRDARPLRAAWCELSQREPPAPLPVSSASIAKWQAGGFDVKTWVAAGPHFWQTTEIEEAPQLLQCTLEAVEWAWSA